MSKKETVQNSFFLVAVIVGIATFVSSYFFLDSEDTGYSFQSGIEILEKKRIYNDSKPDTADYLRILTEDEAKLVNAMSDFLDQGTYKAFPHYISGQSYQEFDREILSRINLEIEYIRDSHHIHEKRQQQKSDLQLWGSVIVLILVSLGNFLGKRMKEADSEQGASKKANT